MELNQSLVIAYLKLEASLVKQLNGNLKLEGKLKNCRKFSATSVLTLIESLTKQCQNKLL